MNNKNESNKTQGEGFLSMYCEWKFVGNVRVENTNKNQVFFFSVYRAACHNYLTNCHIRECIDTPFEDTHCRFCGKEIKEV